MLRQKVPAITIGQYTFEGPYLLDNWSPLPIGGIYVILHKGYSPASSGTYTPDYIGQTENLSERGFLSHHKYHCWLNRAGSSRNIYIAIYRMYNSSESERLFIEQLLISQYQPFCNG